MSAAPGQRSLALDVFRGIAIAGMILVNTPGSWAHIYAPLRHADWHGCTPTDLVFPFFLFATGAAMFFSFARSQYQPQPDVLRGIARRSALLILIGILLNAYPFMTPLSEWRIPGVLQRIGLAYALGALLILYCPGRWRYLISAALLLGYWWLLQTFGGDSPYSLEHNLVRDVDLAVFGTSHLWSGFGIAFDPEGLLSTLPSVVSVVAGFEAARLVGRAPVGVGIVTRLLVIGAAMIGAGMLWNAWFPINKALWTSSYVLFTSGIGWVTLALLMLVLDVWGFRKLGRPLEIYGTNPLFIYIVSIVLARTLWLIELERDNGDTVSLYTWLWEQLLPMASPVNASLIFALVNVALLWWLSLVLYRRGIIIKL